ncbi:hypothetical protein KY084_09805 [Stakelama sp. CBK3Z-3]|uniref:BA14K family protein n=1 Tax=Stakelama flava TaxID=2860338 RepID=A0ABS6XLS4_9SPHN|nr:hypothetical protein [Stakelama flava]MBW4331164.1 hypothetical protein [Stakelama flava]
MITFTRKAALGLALGATAMTAAAMPAQAQRYRHSYHHYHHDNGAGTAIVAGIAGLAIGAAIASSNNDRRYDRGYYRDRDYYPADAYRGRGYYRAPRYCSVHREWDPYRHRSVAVRYCR